MVTDLKLSACLGDLHQRHLVGYIGGTADSFNRCRDTPVLLHTALKKVTCIYLIKHLLCKDVKLCNVFSFVFTRMT